MKIIFNGINGNDEVYMDCLRAICGETEGKAMIDIGCNLAPHTPKLGFSKRTYIDILERTLDHVDEQKNFVHKNALDYLRQMGTGVDVALSLDNIEHLTLNDGKWLIRLMEDVSKKQILFTPLSAWMVGDESDPNPESHKCVWTPDMLPNWASIVFKQYHPTLGIGAWFGFYCKNIIYEFERVSNELKTKNWYNPIDVLIL